MSMLFHASLPLKFWDEDFYSNCFIITKLPTSLLGSKTPLKVLFHVFPYYHFLKFCCCLCWPCLRSYNAHKLQSFSQSFKFLGYSPHHKGYKCLFLMISCILVVISFLMRLFFLMLHKLIMCHPLPSLTIRLF